VQGPVDYFTQNLMGESLVFCPVCILTPLKYPSVTAFNKILLAEGSFWVQNALKSFYGSYNALPDLLVVLGGGYSVPIPLPPECIRHLDVPSGFFTSPGSLNCSRTLDTSLLPAVAVL